MRAVDAAFALGAAVGATVAGVLVHARAEDRVEAVRRTERERATRAAHPTSPAHQRSLASAYAAGRQRERELAQVIPFRTPAEPPSAS